MMKTKVLTVFLGLLVLSGVAINLSLLMKVKALSASLKDAQFQLEVLGEDNKTLNDENQKLKREIESKAELQEAALKKNVELENTLKAKEEELSYANKDLKDALTKIEELNSQVKALQNENAAIKEATKEKVTNKGKKK